MTEIPEVLYTWNGDVSLAYQVVGDGPIDLAFVPGFVGNLDLMWEYPPYARFLKRLASFSRLTVMDRRGTGLSDRLSPDDLPPLEVLMDDLHVVLDEVDSERASLFGFSDTGALCAVFAATYPERTNALAHYGTAAVGAWTDDVQWQWSEEVWSSYMDELAAGWGTLAYAEEILLRFCPSLAGDDRAIRWWAKFMRQAGSPNAAVAIERMWHEVDVRPILSTIGVPTLVMHRTDDDIEPVENGRDIARRIPNARFVELPGGDNLPYAGNQVEVLDELEEFFTVFGAGRAWTGCWRPCCSPTSLGPPRGRQSSEILAGRTCSLPMTNGRRLRSRGSEGTKSTRPGTGSWRPSTDRRAPCAAAKRSLPRWITSVSRSEPACIRVRSSWPV